MSANQMGKKELLALARKAVPGLKTLQVRNTDRLDLHEVSVTALAEALQAAYERGKGADSGVELCVERQREIGGLLKMLENEMRTLRPGDLGAEMAEILGEVRGRVLEALLALSVISEGEIEANLHNYC